MPLMKKINIGWEYFYFYSWAFGVNLDLNFETILIVCVPEVMFFFLLLWLEQLVY